MFRNFNRRNDCDFYRQLKVEFLKFEIRNFTIHYMNDFAKEKKKQIITNFKSELKKLEIFLDDSFDINLGQYNFSIKNE